INPGILNFDFNKNDFSDYLSSTKFVQSENEKIKTVQNSITKGNKNKLDGIRSINKWVYENIEKTPVFSVPNALDVLKSKKGDCNEHSVLFAALSRSYGIPAKIVLGLVYLNGRFYYHAWNEVYLGKWITADATFGQMPSDATHIKLIEGSIEKSVEIVKLVGKLNIQILEVYY
ncbi:MAG: transglutaminase-like domain-containing protein, partial [Thermodesulfobacteriota bacterium]